MTEREIFLAVLDLPDAAARAQYLDKVCGNRAQRARVESLLASHDDPDSFLAIPAVSPPQQDDSRTEELGGAASPDDENEPDAGLDFLQPSTRPDSLGRLGHYEVLEVLGRGGFGVVLRAFDELLQRVVAVKVLAARIAATSPARKRFLREAQSSAKVRHENVVQIYAVEAQPLPYLVMEFIPGETLQQRLNRIGPLETEEVVRIGRHIAEGLAAAHDTGLIHRDIKPGNILIEAGPNERVKITDFGLARAADDASMTQSGVVAGTPMFMAPEQARGDTLDHRADLFSLGSVLYTMCSGRPPFRASNTFAILKRVVEDTPRPIPEIIPEVPPWLCDIIARLHAKKPQERYQSAREVADVLADHGVKLKTQPEGKSIAPASPEKAAAPTAAAPTAAATTAPTVSSGGTKLAVWAAIVLLPVLALAVTEFAGMTQFFRNPQPTPDVRNVHNGLRVAPVPPDAPSPDAKMPPVAVAPLDADAAKKQKAQADVKEWLQLVTSLPANEQVQAVAAKLKEHNPDFDGQATHKIEEGVVTELGFSAENVTDISPVRALTGLRMFRCGGIFGEKGHNGQLKDLTPLKDLKLAALDIPSTLVEDLSPLKGMPLTSLNLWGCDHVSDLEPLRGLPLTRLILHGAARNNEDLTPLKGMPLTVLDVAYSRVRDLTPLQGMALTSLNLWSCSQLSDLAPLKGMPLTSLNLRRCPQLSDLTPLKDMSLEVILLAAPKNITQGLDVLRVMKSLKTIGITESQTLPAEQFWELYDKGEFK